MIVLAFLIALFVNLVAPSGLRTPFWVTFVLSCVSVYGVRWWVLGINDLADAVKALYAFWIRILNSK